MSMGPSMREVARSVLVGLVIASAFLLLIGGGLHYVAPAALSPVSGTSLRPIVEATWIKVPFDIVRTKECLAQSTITLRRSRDYGAGLGVREDVVRLDLYNTTITGLGEHRVMLWFQRPPGLSGLWDYDSKTQDDCGGLLDLTIGSPRHTVVTHLDLGPEE